MRPRAVMAQGIAAAKPLAVAACPNTSATSGRGNPLIVSIGRTRIELDRKRIGGPVCDADPRASRESSRSRLGRRSPSFCRRHPIRTVHRCDR